MIKSNRSIYVGHFANILLIVVFNLEIKHPKY